MVEKFMYPAADPELSESIPDGATFWTPKPSEIEEEGFGFFRNVTDLRGTTAKEARGYLAAHARVFDLSNSRTTVAEDFEVFASAFESGSAADDGVTGAIGAEIDDFIDAKDCDLGVLELGVGAVAYALSAAKMFPASSCRSHSGSRSWSPFPVVYLATSQRRAGLLEKLVIESGYGVVQDPARSDLLVIAGPSIPPILVLAEKIIGCLREFRELSSRTNAPRRPASQNSQPQLFERCRHLKRSERHRDWRPSAKSPNAVCRDQIVER